MLGIPAMITALAAAIPVHKNAAWTWEVRSNSRVSAQSTWRTATVLDSAKDDSGVVWRLRIKDSLSGNVDTALLRSPDIGSQRWVHPSYLLAWEPESLALQNNPWERRTWNDSTAWGFAFFMSSQPRSLGFKFDSATSSYPWPTLSASCAELRSGGTWDAPAMKYQDGLGMVRARLPVLGQRDTYENWTLLANDGQPPTGIWTPAPWSLPLTGSAYEWEEEHVSVVTPPFMAPDPRTNTTKTWWSIVDWNITALTDSAGWAGVKVEQTRTDSTSPTTRSSFVIRGRLSSGELLSCAKGCALPDEFVWRDWADPSTANGFVHHIVANYPAGSGLYTRSTSTLVANVRPNGILDEQTSTNWIDDGSGGGTGTSLNIRLLKANGSSIREPSSLSPRPVSNRILSAGALRRFALEWPMAKVRWSDAKGRSGSARLDAFVRARPTSATFVEIRTPDGQNLSGTVLAR